jgi:hypothetical protein
MSEIDDLIDEVVTEAKNVAESYEWGTSSGAAEKALDEAKTALRARITELEADRDSEARWAKEYLARAERAEQDAERLAEALKFVEFGDSGGVDGPGYCPACGGRGSHAGLDYVCCVRDALKKHDTTPDGPP